MAPEILKILYDYNVEEPNFVVEETLNEAGEPHKKYKIKGTFSTIGEKNRNGRVYPRHLWESAVSKYQQNIKSGSINRLMEWEHPARGTVDPMQAVACIDKLWIEGNRVLGEATLLDNDKGNQLKSLIDNGIKISVSSRGTGKVGQGGVVEKFDLITYDAVAYPSDFNATMEGYITESTENYTLENGVLKEVEIEQEQPLEPAKIVESFKEAFDKINEQALKEGLNICVIYYNKLQEDFKLLQNAISKDKTLSQFKTSFRKIEAQFENLLSEIDTILKEI